MHDLARLDFHAAGNAVLRLDDRTQADVHALLQHTAVIDDGPAVDDASGFDHAVCVDNGVRKDDCAGLHLRGVTDVGRGMDDGRDGAARFIQAMQPRQTAFVVAKGGIEGGLPVAEAFKLRAFAGDIRRGAVVVEEENLATPKIKKGCERTFPVLSQPFCSIRLPV